MQKQKEKRTSEKRIFEKNILGQMQMLCTFEKRHIKEALMCKKSLMK